MDSLPTGSLRYSRGDKNLLSNLILGSVRSLRRFNRACLSAGKIEGYIERLLRT